MSEETLDPKILHTLFTYDDGTGLLSWKTRPSEHFPSRRVARLWNTKFAGKVAGYLNSQNDRRVVRVMLDGVSSNYLAYRIIWAMHHGAWPANTIDHIDGNQMNDRIGNLRDVPFQVNAKNLAVSPSSKSGVLGVSWNRREAKWQARIQINGKQVWLGFHETVEEAAKVRKDAERKYGFHPNHGRKQQRNDRSAAA